MAIQPFDGSSESEQCLTKPSRASAKGQRRSPDRDDCINTPPLSHLGHTDRFLPIQVTLLANETTLFSSTPHSHNHVSRRQIRTLISFPLERHFGTFRHATINVQQQFARRVDDSSTMTRRAHVFGFLAPTATHVTVHLDLLKNPGTELVTDQADASTVTCRTINDVLVGSSTTTVTGVANRFA